MDRRPIIIVIVEDDGEDRGLVHRTLTESRLVNELHFVHDGQELMDYLHRRGPYTNPEQAPWPDLILLDLNMPGKNGREALEEIKSDPRLRHIPVVILTISEAEADIYLSYDLAANSYMVKPVSFPGLAEVLTRLDRYWVEIVEQPPDEGGA